MIRRKYRFYGQVQGVGFRWTALRLAKELNITGYVKNEYDYSVTLEVQGEKDDVCNMIQNIEDFPYFIISGIDTEELEVIPEDVFRVKY